MNVSAGKIDWDEHLPQSFLRSALNTEVIYQE
jgi:hypothetical protein